MGFNSQKPQALPFLLLSPLLQFAEHCTKEGKSASEGGFSFVEHGSESKRPGIG
jgi:hypothetical protein